MSRILALDLSLTGTGLCVVDDGVVTDLRTLAFKTVGHARLHDILSTIQPLITPYFSPSTTFQARPPQPDLAVLEGPSFASSGGQAHERAGLWWMVAQTLWRYDIPYAVIAPTKRAVYATGKGNAGKDAVLLAAERRYGHLADIEDNNQADAVILAAMAAHHLGHPLAEVPLTHSRALTGVVWPEQIGEAA